MLIKQRNLSQRAVELFRCLRHSLARAGSAGKRFLAVGANSSCNRTLFTAALERIVVIARTPRCEVMQTCADLIALLRKEMIETAASSRPSASNSPGKLSGWPPPLDDLSKV